MKKERNKRIEIGLPEYLLSHAKVVAKYRGIKLDELIKESLERTLRVNPVAPLELGAVCEKVEPKVDGASIGEDCGEDATEGREIYRRLPFHDKRGPNLDDFDE